MNGRPDTFKGSYYANPVLDDPPVSDDLKRDFKEYYSRNIWPTDVPEVRDFEEAFKDLGRSVKCSFFFCAPD